MIQKTMPRINRLELPVRSALKDCGTKLKRLYGSSMPGSKPIFEPTEMIIPGGLNFKEKAYYLLKGKLPSSVYERWFKKRTDYIAQQGDQVILVNKSDHYVGSIIESPHDVGEVATSIRGININSSDISEEMVDDIVNDGSEIDVSSDTDDGLSAFEIWKHLLGM